MSLPVFFAQVTNAANAAVAGGPDASTAPAADKPLWSVFLTYALIVAAIYFVFFRPQAQAKKQQEEKLKSAKTGDKVVTTGGIHGVITNVKETTVIVRVADNVKLEVEKAHIEKINRPEDADKSDKPEKK
jgi:preprotein translocase subunit YajC